MAPAKSLAQQLGEKQREISVAEFFERNRQILGFDNPARALLTSVKEAIDNSLDACEEAGLLPELSVEVHKDGADRYRVIVEDNGPGIVRKQIPNVFARLLYGSRFHANRQSRGQQGIGISAAVLYAALTTARPAKITSKVEEEEAAHVVELFIDTQKNLPRIVREDVVLWDRPHGIRVELALKAKYQRGRQSPYEYLKDTAIVNPHARIVLTEPDGTRVTWERAATEMPPVPKEVLPHPYGLELGELSSRLKASSRPTVSDVLLHEFAGVTPRALKEILAAARIAPKTAPGSIHGEELEQLLSALHAAPLLPPSAEALSPIGPLLIKRGLRNVLGEVRPEFFAPPVSRPPKIRGGFPFLVEVGLVYGGGLPLDQPVQLLRFANRVPLLFQQGACAITTAVGGMDWRRYGLDQKGGAGIPTGPCVILVHLASTKIPFTSEAKEAIAEDEEIDREVTLALQAAARHLRIHLSRRTRRELAGEKFDVILKILPRLAAKTSALVGKPVPDLTPVITRIMDVVYVDPQPVATEEKKPATSRFTIDVTNYTPRPRVLELFLEMPPAEFPPSRVLPAPDGVEAPLGRAWWTLPRLEPSGRTRIELDFPSATEVDLDDLDLYVAGVDESHLLGADPLPGDWEVRLPRAIVEAAEAAAAAETADEAEVDYDGTETSSPLDEE